MSKVRTDHPDHVELVQDLLLEAHRNGQRATDLTPGKGDYAAELRKIHTIQALRTRLTPDVDLVDPIRGISFRADGKTHNRRDLHDMMIEANVLAFRREQWEQQKIDTLICYREKTHLGPVDKGFWISHPPHIECIFLPVGPQLPWENNRDEIQAFLRTFFRFEPFRSSTYYPGGFASGDPFVKIAWRDVANLKDWRELLASGPPSGVRVNLPEPKKRDGKGLFGE